MTNIILAGILVLVSSVQIPMFIHFLKGFLVMREFGEMSASKALIGGKII